MLIDIAMNPFKSEFWKFFHKGRFLKKRKNVLFLQVLRLQAAITPQWLQIDGKSLPKITLYGLYYFQFRSSPGDDLIDLLNLRVSGHPSVYVSPYVHNKFFSDFDLISCMGCPRPDVPTCMASTRLKVKVKFKRLRKFRKLHYSRSISSVVVEWSSKLVVDHDTIGPSLQLVWARFSSFL